MRVLSAARHRWMRLVSPSGDRLLRLDGVSQMPGAVSLSEGAAMARNEAHPLPALTQSLVPLKAAAATCTTERLAECRWLQVECEFDCSNCTAGTGATAQGGRPPPASGGCPGRRGRHAAGRAPGGRRRRRAHRRLARPWDHRRRLGERGVDQCGSSPCVLVAAVRRAPLCAPRVFARAAPQTEVIAPTAGPGRAAQEAGGTGGGDAAGATATRQQREQRVLMAQMLHHLSSHKVRVTHKHTHTHTHISRAS